MDTIFVQIASYRDPELPKTLESLFENAKYIENLTVCVAWQHGGDEPLAKKVFKKYKNYLKIINIKHTDSQGVCWARNKIQKRYKGEKYTLQLDSHHRFTKDWDETLITMLTDLQKKGYQKPLLTAYLSDYHPDKDPEGRVEVPYRLYFHRFSPEGIVFPYPETIPNWEKLDSPSRARFYSAHFCFTLGEFCKEVPHNPEYYFHGEEISIAVRAFTHGYDLFHPHRVVVWHEYTRRGKKKHWDDHLKWWERNAKSHLINKKLFGVDGVKQSGHTGKYGFGKVRSLRDYEEYSGIMFSKRAVQQYTLDREDAPNPGRSFYPSEEEWLNSYSTFFRHCIDVGYDKVPHDDYDYWVVAFHGADGKTLFREDAQKEEIHRLKNDPDGYCKIWREFYPDERVDNWRVWPYSKEHCKNTDPALDGWCQPIEGKIA